MLAVTALLPDGPANRPPVILIHGAANSALVWTFWQCELVAAGWPTYALDLRGHGRQDENDPIDLSRTSMHDYASDVRALAEQLARRPVLVGWSLGGLVAHRHGGLMAMDPLHDDPSVCGTAIPSP